mgnify:CR=1 FL=1
MGYWVKSGKNQDQGIFFIIFQKERTWHNRNLTKTWTTIGSKRLRRLKKSLSNDDRFYAIIF